MRKFRPPIALILTSLLLLGAQARPASPGLINHQGRIAVAGTNFDGTGHFKFALVDGAGATTFWSNDDSSAAGSEPLLSLAVPVSKGHYSVALGEANAIPVSVFSANPDVRLRVWFSTDAGGPFEQLSPDRRLGSTGYALSAGSVGGQVTTTEDGGVVIGDPGDGATRNLAVLGESGLGAAHDLELVGNTAYVASGSAGLEIYDVSDPSTITVLGSSSATLGFARFVAVQGDFAYVLDQDYSPGNIPTLEIFDISDPGAIIPRGTVEVDGEDLTPFSSMVVSGNLVFLTLRNDDSIGVTQLLDVSDLDSPSRVPGGELGTGAHVMVARGDLLYLAQEEFIGIGNSQSDLRIYDFSIPTAPVLLDSIEGGLQRPFGLVVEGDFAFVSDSGTNRLYAFDVSDPSDISARGISGPIVSSSIGAAGSGDLVFTVHSGVQKGVSVFDVGDPDDLKLLDFVSAAVNFPASIAAAGNVVAVSNRDNGVPRFFVSEYSALQATINGGLHVSGELFDSSSSPGEVGQVLGSTGGGTGWQDLLDDDPMNELQTLSLSAGTLELNPDGGSVDLSDIVMEIPDGSITEAKLATDSVTTLKIAAGAVSRSKVANGAISDSKLADDSVISSKIQRFAVGTEEIAPSAVTGDKLAVRSVGARELDIGAVTSIDIEDRAINRVDIEIGTITGSEIANDSIGAADLAPGSVGTSEILLGAVTSSKIANGTILSTDIADGTITSSDIANGTITSADIENDSISSSDIGSNAVNSSEIAPQSVDGAHIAIQTITSANIAQGGVSGSNILNGTITGIDINATNLGLRGTLSIGTSDATNDDFIYFDDFTTNKYLRWDESEDRFRFSRALGLNGPLAAGSSGDTIDVAYNFFSNGTVAPDSGDIANSGDVYILNDLEVDGRIYADGGLTNGSDRNRKENITPVDTTQILEKVAALPISHWNYNDDPSRRPHIGTMAQDFHAAFRLGKDDRHISTIDADGVALAAIQALKAENDVLKKQNATILKRLEALEQAVK